MPNPPSDSVIAHFGPNTGGMAARDEACISVNILYDIDFVQISSFGQFDLSPCDHDHNDQMVLFYYHKRSHTRQQKRIRRKYKNRPM